MNETVSFAGTDGWAAASTGTLLVTAAVLLVAFVIIEMRSSHPLLPLRVVLDRNRGGAFLAASSPSPVSAPPRAAWSVCWTW